MQASEAVIGGGVLLHALLPDVPFDDIDAFLKVDTSTYSGRRKLEDCSPLERDYLGKFLGTVKSRLLVREPDGCGIFHRE